MAIKIVRNDRGNCINFYGSSNPTYWNACLSGEVDATKPDTVNIINDIKTAGSGTKQYEFFQIPYTEFVDENENGFANAAEVAAYVDLKGNVLIGTGVTYLGLWSPGLNTPDITTDTSSYNSGDFYKIVAGGSHELVSGEGPVEFFNGDEVIFDGTNWARKPFEGAQVEYDSSSVLLNNNASVYADAAQGEADPQNIEQGWYFTNDEAGKKINWYFVGSQNVAYQITSTTLKNSFARVKMIKTTGDIFFSVYTAPQYDGFDQFWFRSRYTYAGGDFSGVTAGQEVIIYWGDEPTDFPELTRIQLTLDNTSSLISTHPDVSNDPIFSVALSTNSGQAVDENEFLVKNLGYKNEQYTQNYVLEAALETGAVVDESYKDLLNTVVDFKLDATSTSIMLDNGYSYGVNTIKATDAGDGTIKIITMLADRELFFNLDPANVMVNEASVPGGLNDVINTLNELFTVGAFESVVITDPFSTSVADVDGTLTTYALAGSAINPAGDDIAAGVASNYNQSGVVTTDYITKAGEYFTFDIRVEGIIGMGLVHTTDSFNDGYYSGNSTYADPAGFCVGPNSGHYGYQFSHWFHPSPDGPWTNYGANTSYSMREGWSSSNYAFRYSDEGQDWRDGTNVKMRVGIDANAFISIDYYDADRDTLWTPIARSAYPVIEGIQLRLGIKFGDINTRLYTAPKVHLLPVTAPTMYFRYIESPDGQYSYPLFATEEEANYYDLQEGGSGTSHTHLYADDPTFTNWWMPDTNSVMNTGAAPTSAQTFEGQPINWTEITSLTNADLAPSSYSSQTITVNELSAVNIQLHPQDAPYVTTIIDNDNSGLVMDANGAHLIGTAPEVLDDNVVNPSDTYTITVRRSNSYGSADGTLTLVVNNLTAPEETVDGFHVHTGSISGGLMQPGSVYELQHQGQDLTDAHRFIIPRQWVNDNVLPYLLGAGDTYVAGFLNGTHDTSTLETSDFDFAIIWEYVDANSHKFSFVRDGSVMTGGGSANVSTKSITVNSMTSAVYDFAIELDGTSAWLIACNVNNIMNEASPNDGGVFSHYAEVTNYDTGHAGIHFGVISMEGGLEEGTATLTVIDTPAPAPTNLTSWNKALDFSGSSERAVQVNQNTTYNALRMNGLSATVGGNANANYTTSLSTGRPWATAVVFKIDGNSSNQHIWNSGEGAGSTDDNIYLRVDANRNLYFGWGRQGALNELFFGTLNTNTWYGCYIASTGERLSGANATPSNLADCFDVRLLSDVTNWQMYANNSTSTMWGLTNSTTGGRMDRSILGDFTVGGRGSNRNFHGKIASMVITTLKLNVPMPTDAEIHLMITDPKKWEDDYLVGQTIRQSHYTTNATYSPSNIYAGYGAVQMWLMGDGANDSYSNMIRNQVYPNDQNYTRLNMISMVSNDIENVNINGLS